MAADRSRTGRQAVTENRWWLEEVAVQLHPVAAAATYMASVGRTGIRELSGLNHDKCEYLKSELKKAGFEMAFDSPTFNEFVVKFPTGFETTYERLLEKKIVAGLSLAPYYPELTDHYLLCVTETMTRYDMDELIKELRN